MKKMSLTCQRGYQRGFVLLYFTVVILGLVAAGGVGIALVTRSASQRSQSGVLSRRAYWVSEAGIEDATYRVRKNLPYPLSYSVPVGSSQAAVTVTANGNLRTVESRGTQQSAVRTLRATLELTTINPTLFYGAQVGEGGVTMAENSRVEGTGGTPGNLYSNGSVTGGNGATVTGDVTVAGAGSMENVVVLGTARGHTITSSKVCADAYYQIIDSSSLNFLASPTAAACPSPLTPGTAFGAQPDPSVQSPPMTQTQIDQFKADAVAGGTITGNCGDAGAAECVIGENATLLLGPKKIVGNLALTKKQTLVVTGTLHFTGSISLDSGGGATIKCAAAFGVNGCAVLTDSWIHIKNNAVFQGSGTAGSYLLVITTLAGCNGGSETPPCTHHNAALDLHNNATGAVFYVPNSMANLHNGVSVTEITAYKLGLDNNAIVRYEQGLQNAQFSFGPGASFRVTSWREVE